jgi:hypothetical protein
METDYLLLAMKTISFPDDRDRLSFPDNGDRLSFPDVGDIIFS